MRILDRYLLREFAGYLLLGLAGFVVIFVVVDLFEKIDVFLDHRAPLPLVVQFYLYLAPDVVVKVLPVALLLATFLALGQLNKFGELTAMRSAGLSLWRILVPVFGVAALCSMLSLFLGEYVVPGANRTRDEIWEEKIQSIHRPSVTERADVTYLGEGGRIWYMRLYLVAEKRMHEVSLQEFRAAGSCAASTPPKPRGTGRAGSSCPATCARSTRRDGRRRSSSRGWPWRDWPSARRTSRATTSAPRR